MGTATNYCALAVFIAANIVTLTAVGFTLAALFTDQWMITRFTSQEQMNHFHGLFTYCVEYKATLNLGKNQNSFYDKTRCRKMGEEVESTLDEVGTWNRVMLGTLILAAICGLVGVITGYIAAVASRGETNACGKCSLICCCIFHLVAAVLAIIGVIYFRWLTFDEDYKIEQMPRLDLEAPVEIGSSFTWSIIGCVLYVASALLTLVGAVIKLCGSGIGTKPYASSKTHSHYRTNAANVSQPTAV